MGDADRGDAPAVGHHGAMPPSSAPGAQASSSRRRVVAAVVAALVVAVLVVGLVGGGGGDGAAEDPTATTSAPPVTEPGAGDPPTVVAPQVAVAGTLERAGSDLVARVTVTNAGTETAWVPIGPDGAVQPLLVPAAAGDGLVDLGLVVPPSPVGVEGADPAFTFRPVPPGGQLDLEVTDAPPPPDALLDPAGEPVEVSGFRLCVDAFADAALPAEARRPVEGGADVVVDVAAIEGEASRTCGPTLDA